MTSRIQRYRLVCEFELRNRGDYSEIRNRLYGAIRSVFRRFGSDAQLDYVAIEKIETVQIERSNQR